MDIDKCEQHNQNAIIFIKLDPFRNMQYIFTLSLHLKWISIWITGFIGFQ